MGRKIYYHSRWIKFIICIIILSRIFIFRYQIHFSYYQRRINSKVICIYIYIYYIHNSLYDNFSCSILHHFRGNYGIVRLEAILIAVDCFRKCTAMHIYEVTLIILWNGWQEWVVSNLIYQSCLNPLSIKLNHVMSWFVRKMIRSVCPAESWV